MSTQDGRWGQQVLLGSFDWPRMVEAWVWGRQHVLCWRSGGPCPPLLSLRALLQSARSATCGRCCGLEMRGPVEARLRASAVPRISMAKFRPTFGAKPVVAATPGDIWSVCGLNTRLVKILRSYLTSLGWLHMFFC
jgi:hypothetical protein